MLAALILEVMDRSESDSLKVMIYLIEAVLPEGYFANNLRGLSVDMAVFRDLLKLRLPRLSAHLEKLQKGAAEGIIFFFINNINLIYIFSSQEAVMNLL
jgi:TBC1 domain family member 30